MIGGLMWMIFRPSSVSVSTSPISSAEVTAAGAAVTSGAGSGAAGVARIREIGGRKGRFTPSAAGARFGFGVCGSIRETLSTTGFGAGTGSEADGAAGLAGGFFAVIGAKADLIGAIVDAGAAGFS